MLIIIFLNVSFSSIKAHGEDDVVVSHQWGIKSHRALKNMITGSAPVFKSIEVSYLILYAILFLIILSMYVCVYIHGYVKGMGHSSDPEEIEAVKNFIAEKLN